MAWTDSLRDTPEFQRGEEFERALSAYLQARGWGVLPVYDYSGEEQKAPKMHRARGGLVLPDLFTAQSGKTFWCEAKRKTGGSEYRKTGVYETGISLRLYRHYQQVKRESGIDVWLFFGHERDDEVRCIEIDRHVPRPYTGTKMGSGGMAFWPWDVLIPLCQLSELLPLHKAGAA